MTGTEPRRLAVYEWGADGAPRVVFLHGVTSHGRHAAHTAERLADRFHVLAPDLLGHGSSSWEPPWNVDAHLDAVLATVGDAPAAWIGHSFGARLAFELAARNPALVERLVLLDPALRVPAEVALFAAERERRDRSYESFSTAIERRYEESQLHRAERALLEAELHDHLLESPDGRWRYRYCQSAVIVAYGEMAKPPPPYTAVEVPTLVLLGERSYLPYDHFLETHRAALGDRLEVARVPGGHTVLWDAPDETARALEGFLGSPPA
jgi:lipase